MNPTDICRECEVRQSVKELEETIEENNKTDTNIDINWNYKLRDINTELHKALHELVVEDVEYMILNSLGDPYKKQTINNAITAMDKNTGICK